MRPTEGEVYISNHNISKCSDDELAHLRREKIGYLFRNNTLIKELSVYENIIMPALLNHKKYNEAFYQELIDRLQLKKILFSSAKNLTISQMQRIICARALINNPDIILADEPSCDSYQPMDKDILDFLLNMVYLHHKTLILATNDTGISIFVDHIIKLRDGKIIEDKIIS
jgi:putative ABC transport system ATP-binding protein